MKERNKRLFIAGLSGAVGGAFGAVSGANSWFVVAAVAAFFAIMTAWGLHGAIQEKELQ